MADETPQTSAPEVAEDEQPKGTHNGKAVMAVKVYAPFKVYFEGDAYSLSAVNATGPFDILPHHRNFLCMLVPCNLTVQTLNGPQMIKISRALMHVKSDRITVFVDV